MKERDEAIVRLAERLSAGLGLEPLEVDLFDARLWRWWNGELGLAEELFADEPDLLFIEVVDLQARLAALEGFFAEREEWERCARTRDLRSIGSELIARLVERGEPVSDGE